MKPTTKALVSLAIVLVACIALAVARRPAQADITIDVSTRVYTPEFDDWVVVSTSAICGASNPDYTVGVVKVGKKNGMRFQVACTYANTPAGLHWFQVDSPKIRAKIDVLCRRWTAEGNRISVNDFDFTFQKSG